LLLPAEEQGRRLIRVIRKGSPLLARDQRFESVRSTDKSFRGLSEG
jgi:hypothetical protein